MAPTRRTFLRTVSAVGAAGATVGLVGCRPGSEEETRLSRGAGQPAAEERLPWVKDPSPFIRHPTNLETRLEDLDGFLTPKELFFVRNHAPTPRIDAESYRLRIEGDSIKRPVDLSYDDLLRLPSQTVVSYLECAGNWRGLYPTVMGQTASGGQWNRGAVGCATWSGVSVASVLEVAGVKPNAVDVNLFGLDDGAFNRPMPVEKALDADTILAYTMNGLELPPDHGYPIRAVVPGWAGSNSVKWVGRIEVTAEKQWVKNNTTSYVLIGPEWPAEEYEPAEGAPITTLNVKSTLALPWPAEVAAGERRLRGFAYSPNGRIRQVEWSVDKGEWRQASLIPPVLERAWVRFELTWTAKPGEHVVRVRATDARGNAQPMSQPANRKGYLLNVVLPHPVTVL